MSAETVTKDYINNPEIDTRIDSVAVQEQLAQIAVHESIDGFAMLESDTRAFEVLRSEMKSRIVGQDTAVDAIFDQLTLFETRPDDDDRPAASFAFVGPNGVGKKKTAEVLGEILGDGSGYNVARVDCFDYLDSERISQFISGIGNFIHQNNEPEIPGLPSNVVIFDNFERSSPEMQYLILQILGGVSVPYIMLDPETETQHHGIVDWRNTVVVFACDHKIDGPSIGFMPKGDIVENGVRANNNAPDHFKRIAPEFASRINAEVQFHELDKDEYGEVLDAYLNERNDEFIERYGVYVSLDDNARNHLLLKAAKAESHNGAYSLMEVFAECVQRRLSVEVLNETVDPGTEVRVFERGGELLFGTRPDESLEIYDELDDEDEDGFASNVYPGLE